MALRPAHGDRRTYRVVRQLPIRRANPANTFVIDENVGYLVAVAARHMARSLNRRLADHGVTVGQWTVLLHLWASDGLSQRELSQRIGIEEATMTRTLDRMVRDGLVRRRRDRRDKRQYNISITPRGQRLRDRLVPCAIDVVAMVTENLSRRDASHLIGALRRVIASGRADNEKA